MKRECTKAESLMIKYNTQDILSFKGMYTEAIRSKGLVLLLGLIVSLGLSVLASFLLHNLGLTINSFYGEIVFRIVFAVFIITVIECSILIWRKIRNKKSLGDCIPGSKFWVNGGTIINYVNYNRDEAWLTFTEDDSVDDVGNMYSIQFPAPSFLNVKQGERIILAYSDKGVYMPLQISERTKGMVSMEHPARFNEVDWNMAPKLPHPAALDLDKVAYLMNEEEVATFYEKCNRFKSIQIKNWIGIVMSSLLILFLLALLFVILVASDVIIEASSAIGVGALILIIWIFGSYGFARVVLSGALRGMKKLRHKKKVLFLYITDSYGSYSYSKSIYVYEYADGALILNSYPINSNAFLPKDIPYGEVIYKYSKDAESGVLGLNYFAPIINEQLITK